MEICATGCHGSGKSTLINKLKDRYADARKSVFVVEEVARACPHKLGTIRAQRWIWYEHWNREIEARNSGCDMAIMDRSVLDNLCYFRDVLNQNPSKHGEDSFKFFYPIAQLHMLKYDYVIRLPLNEDYITNADDTLRPKDLEYARRIDRIFDDMVDPFVNATVEDLL